MHRRDGYHPDHPITGRQVKLLRLAVGALPRDDLGLAALSGSDPHPPTRGEYARLYALLIRVADQGGTFDLDRVCGCCVNNQCGCHGTALRPAYGGQLSAQPRSGETPVADTDLCACPAPASSRTFPYRCLACGYRLPGTVGDCLHCAGLIALNPGGRWAMAGTDGQTACQEAPDHEHHPALLLSAGTGEDGTCNCQEPGPAESDERTCRNCDYPLSEAQRRELARLLGRSTEPGG